MRSRSLVIGGGGGGGVSSGVRESESVTVVSCRHVQVMVCECVLDCLFLCLAAAPAACSSTWGSSTTSEKFRKHQTTPPQEWQHVQPCGTGHGAQTKTTAVCSSRQEQNHSRWVVVENGWRATPPMWQSPCAIRPLNAPGPHKHHQAPQTSTFFCRAWLLAPARP